MASVQRSAVSVESQLYKHLPDRSRGPTPVEKRGVDLRQAYTTGERKREREREGGRGIDDRTIAATYGALTQRVKH